MNHFRTKDYQQWFESNVRCVIIRNLPKRYRQLQLTHQPLQQPYQGSCPAGFSDILIELAADDEASPNLFNTLVRFQFDFESHQYKVVYLMNRIRQHVDSPIVLAAVNYLSNVMNANLALLYQASYRDTTTQASSTRDTALPADVKNCYLQEYAAVTFDAKFGASREKQGKAAAIALLQQETSDSKEELVTMAK